MYNRYLAMDAELRKIEDRDRAALSLIPIQLKRGEFPYPDREREREEIQAILEGRYDYVNGEILPVSKSKDPDVNLSLPQEVQDGRENDSLRHRNQVALSSLPALFKIGESLDPNIARNELKDKFVLSGRYHPENQKIFHVSKGKDPDVNLPLQHEVQKRRKKESVEDINLAALSLLPATSKRGESPDLKIGRDELKNKFTSLGRYHPENGKTLGDGGGPVINLSLPKVVHPESEKTLGDGRDPVVNLSLPKVVQNRRNLESAAYERHSDSGKWIKQIDGDLPFYRLDGAETMKPLSLERKAHKRPFSASDRDMGIARVDIDISRRDVPDRNLGTKDDNDSDPRGSKETYAPEIKSLAPERLSYKSVLIQNDKAPLYLAKNAKERRFPTGDKDMLIDSVSADIGYTKNNNVDSRNASISNENRNIDFQGAVISKENGNKSFRVSNPEYDTESDDENTDSKDVGELNEDRERGPHGFKKAEDTDSDDDDADSKDVGELNEDRKRELHGFKKAEDTDSNDDDADSKDVGKLSENVGIDLLGARKFNKDRDIDLSGVVQTNENGDIDLSGAGELNKDRDIDLSGARGTYNDRDRGLHGFKKPYDTDSDDETTYYDGAGESNEKINIDLSGVSELNEDRDRGINGFKKAYDTESVDRFLIISDYLPLAKWETMKVWIDDPGIPLTDKISRVRNLISRRKEDGTFSRCYNFPLEIDDVNDSRLLFLKTNVEEYARYSDQIGYYLKGIVTLNQERFVAEFGRLRNETTKDMEKFEKWKYYSFNDHHRGVRFKFDKLKYVPYYRSAYDKIYSMEPYRRHVQHLFRKKLESQSSLPSYNIPTSLNREDKGIMESLLRYKNPTENVLAIHHSNVLLDSFYTSLKIRYWDFRNKNFKYCFICKAKTEDEFEIYFMFMKLFLIIVEESVGSVMKFTLSI